MIETALRLFIARRLRGIFLSKCNTIKRIETSRPGVAMAIGNLMAICCWVIRQDGGGLYEKSPGVKNGWWFSG
jgi:hypothetical protein